MMFGMMGASKIGMMGKGYGYFPFWDFFALLTWIALFSFLVLGAMFFWKELQRKK